MTELERASRWLRRRGIQVYVAVDAAGAALLGVYAGDAETARGRMRTALRQAGRLQRWNQGGQVVRIAG